MHNCAYHHIAMTSNEISTMGGGGGATFNKLNSKSTTYMTDLIKWLRSMVKKKKMKETYWQIMYSFMNWYFWYRPRYLYVYNYACTMPTIVGSDNHTMTVQLFAFDNMHIANKCLRIPYCILITYNVPASCRLYNASKGRKNLATQFWLKKIFVIYIINS